MTLLSLGCAAAKSPSTTPHAAQPRFVVLEHQWASSPPGDIDGAARLTAALAARHVVEVVRAKAACEDDLDCARDAGIEARADKVMLTKLAALGDTLVIRVTVFDVHRQTQERSLQEVVRPPSTENVDAALTRLATALTEPYVTRPPAPEEDEWYESGWVWAGGAALVAGAAVAVVLVATSSKSSNANKPDAVIELP